MVTYVYCSYKGSPCGYRLGKFDSSQEEDTIRLNNENISTVIVKILKNDFIKTAYGRIPNTDEYIVTLKDLEFESKNGEDISKKYFNFVFVFNEAEPACEFQSKLMNKKINDNEKLSWFDSFVVVDKTNKDFGLVIDKGAFDEWLNWVNERQVYAESRCEDFGFLNIETYTSIDKLDKLTELFGRQFYREKNTNKYSTPKKMMSWKMILKTWSQIPWYIKFIAIVPTIVAVLGIVKILSILISMIVVLLNRLLMILGRNL